MHMHGDKDPYKEGYTLVAEKWKLKTKNRKELRNTS